MEQNKKPIFESISVEEAKKIRAYDGGRDNPPSGLQCASGGDWVYETCLGQYSGAWCCHLENGGKVYGRCEIDYTGPALMELKCATNHGLGSRYKGKAGNI